MKVALEVDDAIFDPEFGVVHAWNPKDRVIIMLMEYHHGRRRENVLVEVEDLDTYLLCPTNVEGIIDALAWKACDHEGRRRFVPEGTK